MALSAAMVLEIRPGGSDTNGGGFKAGATGTDWSLQDSPQYSVTDGVTAGSSSITSATANFGTDVVGNLMYVQGGTGSVAANWYEIIGRANNTTITVDRATGLTSGTGVTLKIGGAFGSLGVCGPILSVSGMTAWMKSGSYNMSTSTAGSNGPFATNLSAAFFISGYQNTRGDVTGIKPVITWTASAPGAQTFMASLASGGLQEIRNIGLDGANTTNVSGVTVSGGAHRIVLMDVSNCSAATQVGIRTSAGAIPMVFGCRATNCTTGFNITGVMPATNCSAIGCGTGYVASGMNCLAHACTTAGFSPGANNSSFYNCTADSTSSGSGFLTTTNAEFINCLATNNSAYGFDIGALTAILNNCASYNNTSGRTDVAAVADANPILLTTDPYVDLGADDFRPNTAAGGGALLRAAGIGVYGQTDNCDVGAVQHSDPAGGGGGLLVHPGLAGGV